MTESTCLEFKSLLRDLSRYPDTRVQGVSGAGVGPGGLSLAAGPLQELQEVLLDGSFMTRATKFHRPVGSTALPRLYEFLSNLPVE